MDKNKYAKTIYSLKLKTQKGEDKTEKKSNANNK